MRRVAGAVGIALFLLVSPATAGDASAAAEDLFQRAKTLIAAGKWSDACPLLAESYRLDPAGGTLQNLAVCHESARQWASAYARFQEMKTLAKKATPPRADRVRFADDHLAKITPKVSHLVVLSDEAAATVEIEGITYERAAWSAGIALDPGAHDVMVTVAGKKPFKTSVTIPNEGTEQKLSVPALEVIPIEAPPSAQLMDDRHTKEEEAARERDAQNRRVRRLGYFVAGGGALMLGGSAVFGLLTLAKSRKATSLCHDHDPTEAGYNADGECIRDSQPMKDANALKSQARTFAVVTDVLGAVGLVAVAAGIYISFVRADANDKAATLTIVPALGGATASGTF